MTASRRPGAADLRGRTLHVAGMSRGGTTYLYHTLQRHPQLFLPERKEVCYFGHANHHGLDWWLDFHRGIRDDQVAVDICGLYFMDDAAVDRMLAFNPEARVILSLRDPFDWIYSVYEHYSTLFATPDLETFVSGCTWHRDGRDIALEFADGKIRRTVERMQSLLGSNLLLIDFALIRRDPLRMLRAIEEFCGVEAWFGPDNFSRQRINPRGSGQARRLGRLSTVPGVSALARRLPRGLVMAVRRFLETDRGASGRESRRAPRPVYSEAQQKFVQSRLAADRAFLIDLFAHSPLVVGREPVGE